MSFNSVEYLLFFAGVFILFYLLPFSYRTILVLFVSIGFYATSGWVLLTYPALITIIIYFTGIWMERKRSYLLFYFIVLLAIIGYLLLAKYSNLIFGLLSNSSDVIPIIRIAIPLGISFITFQAIGYLIEIYRGAHKAERNFLHLATYIFFFPKVAMGPVERAHAFLPQLKNSIPFQYSLVVSGMRLFCWGLFKKLVIADRISVYTSELYAAPDQYHGLSVLIVAFLFTIQLYADFSGYTDMAIGSARMLGIRLMENFKAPLGSLSITDFWRRWHISLSTWFNEYFFSPLAIFFRNAGQWGVVMTTLITFLIIGMWHGPTLGFVIFGLIHGVLISFEFLTRKARKKIKGSIIPWLTHTISIAYTICAVSFSLIFFRAGNLDSATNILQRIPVNFASSIHEMLIADKSSILLKYGFRELLLLSASVFLILSFDWFPILRIYIHDLQQKSVWLRFGFLFLLILALALGGVFHSQSEFIYQKF